MTKISKTDTKAAFLDLASSEVMKQTKEKGMEWGGWIIANRVENGQTVGGFPGRDGGM